MEIEFKRSVLKQLKYYKKKKPLVYKMIYEKLEEIIENPNDIRYEKVRKYPNYKRARKGSYRICFKVSDECIYIGSIEERSKVYN